MHPNTSIIKKSLAVSTVVVLFIVSCGGSINPVMWKSQAERRLHPQILIQPEKVAQFYQDTFRSTDDPTELFEIIVSEILYTNDFFNHASLDHLPTAEEVLLTRQDDCDGQAVLLCSVLRYAGYDAYTVVGPSHAWVEVRSEETILINYRGGDGFVKFNESSVEWDITPLILLIMEELLLLTVVFSLLFYAYERGFFTYVQEVLGYFKYVLLFFSGYILIGVLVLFAKSTLWVLWLNVFLISILLVIKGFNYLNNYWRQRDKPKRNQKK